MGGAGSDHAATFAIVSTTVSSAEEAKRLARASVEERLAACVQILPMESVYRWDGAVEETREWLLVSKIKADDFATVESAILSRHSYDTPELIMTPITHGSEAYLSWIAESTLRQ